MDSLNEWRRTDAAGYERPPKAENQLCRRNPLRSRCARETFGGAVLRVEGSGQVIAELVQSAHCSDDPILFCGLGGSTGLGVEGWVQFKSSQPEVKASSGPVRKERL